MLSCRDVTALASRLVDGELSFRERFLVRMHLLMCVHCRRFLHQLRTLLESLRRRHEVGATTAPAFIERVMAALDRTRTDPRALPGADGR